MTRGPAALSLVLLLAACQPAPTGTVTTTGGPVDPNFAAVNGAFGAMKGATSAVAGTTLPAAAIATTLASIELAKALSGDSQKALADVGGNAIKPGGAGIVAAGGGNLVSGGGPAAFSPLYALMQATTGDRTLKVSGSNVTADVVYSVNIEPDKTVKSVVKSFKGDTNGYTLDAKGNFSFKPAEAGAATRGTVHCDMTGTITYKDLILTLDELKLDAADPLPKSAKIGSFKITGKDGTKAVAITAELNTTDAGKVKASGDLSVDGEKKPITFDQDKPQIADADLPQPK